MKTRSVTYLKLSVIRSGREIRVHEYDKDDAEQLFAMLVRLERKKSIYSIKLCQAQMLVTGEGGASCMK